MSLYGDLPQAKDEDAASKGWASASKKLQPTFRPKQAGVSSSSSLLAVPPSVRAGGAGRTGGRSGSSDGGRGGGRGPPPVVHVSATAGGSFNAAPAAVMPGPHASTQHSSFSFLKAVNGEPLKDEYDPSKPNDYEEIMREREKRKQAAEEEAERAARLREAEQVCVSKYALRACKQGYKKSSRSKESVWLAREDRAQHSMMTGTQQGGTARPDISLDPASKRSQAG